MTTANATTTLPENAYQPLAPGAANEPLVPTSARVPELTLRSVRWGFPEDPPGVQQT